MRALVAALALIFAAAPAAALEPRDLPGEWSTEWSAAPDGAATAAADMHLRLEPEGALDGVWRGPGLDGIMHGRIEPGEGGTLIWRGEWAHIDGPGIARGRFELVFERGAFTGTWSTDGVDDAEGMWRGRKRR